MRGGPGPGGGGFGLGGPGGFGGPPPGFGGPPPGLFGPAMWGPWGPGPFWGPPIFFWTFPCGPKWLRCPGLPFILFILLWGLLYGIFVIVEYKECGPAVYSACASSYGIAAGAIFSFLAIIYIILMLCALRPPDYYHPDEAEGLLSGGRAEGGSPTRRPPSTIAEARASVSPPRATVTSVEKV